MEMDFLPVTGGFVSQNREKEQVSCGKVQKANSGFFSGFIKFHTPTGVRVVDQEDPHQFLNLCCQKQVS